MRWLKCGILLSLKLHKSLLRPKGYEGITLRHYSFIFSFSFWCLPFFCCRHIFLFDAAVIVCKRRGDNYEMKEVIDLHSFKITNNPTSERENRKVCSRSPNCLQSSLLQSRGQQMCCYAVVPWSVTAVEQLSFAQMVFSIINCLATANERSRHQTRLN